MGSPTPFCFPSASLLHQYLQSAFLALTIWPFCPCHLHLVVFVSIPWIMEDPILLCPICPGQPRFSDVSHLLTHAASKAHLANHFKLKLRTEDPHAVELLQQYDEWFDANGFSKQLANRMANKENRKRQSAEASTSCAPKTTRNQAPNAKAEASDISAAPLIPYFLDPRLADSYNGNQQDMIATLMPTTPERSPNLNSDTRPRMGPVLRSMRSSTGTASNFEQLADAPALTDGHRPLALPVTPTQSRRRLDPEETSWTSGRDTPDPSSNSVDNTESSGDADMEKIRAEEISRLKGVQWPGMDIFDSATPKKRRKRNQKKDGNVLKLMEITSSRVEPNEQVFSPHGSLLKEREITGNVEEYSPLRGETPVPKRRIPRTQSNRLMKADPNVPRAMDRKRQKTAARKGRKTARDELPKEELVPPRRSHRATDRTRSYIDDDEDLGLTIKAFGKRPRGLGIFVDQDEGMQTMYQEQNTGFKAHYETLTPTRLLLNGKASGTLPAGAGHIAVAKENTEPILNSQGRIGSHGWHSPIAKRAVPDGFDIGSPFLFDPVGPHNSNDRAGYRSNPLHAPLKHPFYDNQFEEEPAATQGNWLSMNQTAPSEETISEEDSLLSSYYLSADPK